MLCNFHALVIRRATVHEDNTIVLCDISLILHVFGFSGNILEEFI